MTHAFRTTDIPDLSGRTVLITGANSGLGLESTRALAARGANVVLACRRPSAAAEAVESIQRESPGASLETLELDLADLASIERAAKDFRSKHARLDVLLNNAGVMALPYRETANGFEMQFGTNHLGHFALTGRLIDTLLATPNSRIVSVSSVMHRTGRMNFDDLHGKKRYEKWSAYGQSKLANLLFTLELSKRLGANGASTIAVAAHPGYAATNLQTTGPKMESASVMEAVSRFANAVAAQSAESGALPLLYAATWDGAKQNDYFGPRVLEMWGAPTRSARTRAAKSEADAARLWQASVEATGVSYLD